MVLKFEINKQIIKRLDKEKPVQYSQKFLKAFFMFTDDWNDFSNINIIFTFEGDSYCVPIKNPKHYVEVPADVLLGSGFYISAYGVNSCGDKRITANRVFVPLKESGYTDKFTPVSPTQKDIFTDIWDEIHSIQPYLSLEQVDDYLYETYYNTLLYDYAFNYLQKTDSLIREPCACSSFKNGNFYGRNFDWTYDETVEFVVHTLSQTGYYSTLGVASGIKGLTKEFVESKKYSNLYKIIPFMVSDVMNEKGLVISTHVVPSDKGKNKKTIPDIEVKTKLNALMLPRFCADRFRNASECVDYLKNYVSLYMSKSLLKMGYNQHWMVSDLEKTYVVEVIDNKIIVIDISEKPYITNFHIDGVVFNDDGGVYTPYTQDEEHNAQITNHVTKYGCGLERYNIINDNFDKTQTKTNVRELLKKLSYTKSYTWKTNPFWFTEFVGINKLTTSSLINEFVPVINKAIHKFKNRSRDPLSENYGTWHTSHSSIYNMYAKKLYVYSQEEDVEYEYTMNSYCSLQDVQEIIDNLKLSDLQDDENHRTVSDSEKTYWSDKSEEQDLNQLLEELAQHIKEDI